MTLEQALRDLAEQYELDEYLTHDTLKELKIRAKLELVRELLEKLATEPSSTGEETKR